MNNSVFVSRQMLTAKFFVVLLMGNICFVSPDLGLADEKIWFKTNQPVSLKSKHILVDQKSGSIIYRGNVQIKQGSLIIMAAKAKTTTAGNQPDHVWANGNPVKIQNRYNGDLVVLTAASVHYDVKSGVIALSGNVKLKMGNDTLDSRNLTYNVKSNTITVNTKDNPLNASFDPEHIEALLK